MGEIPRETYRETYMEWQKRELVTQRSSGGRRATNRFRRQVASECLPSEQK